MGEGAETRRMKPNEDEVKKVEGGEELKVHNALKEGLKSLREEVSGLLKGREVCP